MSQARASLSNSLNDILLRNSNGVNPTFTAPDAPTDLFFSLRVTDPQGNQSQFDNVEVSVIADDSPVILSNALKYSSFVAPIKISPPAVSIGPP